MRKIKKGFTLVELIIVIAVIGVLAAILIPVFANVIEKENAKSALSDARNTVEQLIIKAADHPDMPEQLVIFVRKANSLYVFGYDRAAGGALQISNGNSHEFSGYTDVASLNAAYGGSVLFYLVPASDTSSGIRGIQDGMTDYTDILGTYASDIRMAGDDIAVYKGILADGTWTSDDSNSSGSSTSSDNTGTNPGTNPASPSTKIVNLTLNDSWNENSETVQVEVPNAETCTWADIKAQDSITGGFWYCANDSETVTISGSAASVSNVTKMLTTGYTDNVTGLTINDYSVYTGTGSAFQGITSPAGFYKIDDTQAGMSGKYVQLAKIDLSSTYNTTDWCSGTNGKEDASHTSDTIGGFGASCGVFNGIYDGTGKCLTGFSTNLEGSTATFVGMFAQIGTSGIVKDVNFYNPGEIIGAYCVGGITGYNKGQILYCTLRLEDRIHATQWTDEFFYDYGEGGCHAGGVAGSNEGTIKFCSVTTSEDISGIGHVSTTQANMENNGAVGGIAGSNIESGLIDQCVFYGNLNSSLSSKTGGFAIGGIAGLNYTDAVISNCFAYNNYLNGFACIGGIAGVSIGTVTNCVAATFSRQFHDWFALGEVVGLVDGQVTNCYYDNANGAGAFVNNGGNGGGGTEIDLSAATEIPGYDASIWSFPSGAMPILLNAANHQEH